MVDNFDFQEVYRDIRVGRTATMRHLTTAILVRIPGIRYSLRKTMLRNTVPFQTAWVSQLSQGRTAHDV